MITPNDIASKKFEKSMGGYKQESVDNFLLAVAEDMQTLMEEKADLEDKIVILAEKLEEYRNDEDSLRIALLSAQKLGDSVIREAKSKAEMIMRDATSKTEKMMDTAHKQIEREQITLIKLQKEVTAFKSKLMGLYKNHLEVINKLPNFAEYEEEPEKETVKPQPPIQQESGDTIEIPVSDIEEYASKKEQELPKQEYYSKEQQAYLEEEYEEEVELEEFKEEYEEEQEEEQESSSRSESRFGPLKFGDAFDFKGRK